VVRGDRCGDDDRVHGLVLEHLVDSGRPRNGWIAPLERSQRFWAQIACPDYVGFLNVMEVPNEVWAPVAEPDHGDPDWGLAPVLLSAHEVAVDLSR
jgi:hypothetical protein